MEQERFSGRRGQAARNDGRTWPPPGKSSSPTPTPRLLGRELARGSASARCTVAIRARRTCCGSCAEGLGRYVVEAAARRGRRQSLGGVWWLPPQDRRRGRPLPHRPAGRDLHPDRGDVRDAQRAGELNQQIVARAKAGGGLRDDVAAGGPGPGARDGRRDPSRHLRGRARTADLRQRYLSLCLDGLRAQDEPLAGPPPTDEELGRRWVLRISG